LGGGGDAIPHGEFSEKAAHLADANSICGAAVNKTLKLAQPKPLGCQLTEEGADAGERAGRMPVFATKVEVEEDPPVVVRALRGWHLGPFQPPLVGYRGFCGNLLYRNMYG
jgi:hypothetical protein